MLARPGLAHSPGVESTAAPRGCNGKRPVAHRPPAINPIIEQTVDARARKLTRARPLHQPLPAPASRLRLLAWIRLPSRWTERRLPGPWLLSAPDRSVRERP